MTTLSLIIIIITVRDALLDNHLDVLFYLNNGKIRGRRSQVNSLDRHPTMGLSPLLASRTRFMSAILPEIVSDLFNSFMPLPGPVAM